LLELFASLLHPDGVLVFSTSSPAAVKSLRPYQDLSWADRLFSDHARSGFGYAEPQEEGEARGLSACSPERVERVITRQGILRVVDYSARGWAGTQDVFTCVRAE
jgi:hypothetical protein